MPSETMGKGRLEAFSDGVLAILITIMVLELHVPHEPTLASLVPVLPKLAGYVLSFLYLGIYWNNHHHLLHTVKRVSGGVLWANLNLLFWLSLFPAATAWIGETHAARLPTAVYGLVCLLSAVAYYVLQGRIMASDGDHSVLREALGADVKGRLSIVAYVVAVAVSSVQPAVAVGLYVLVALVWLVPDRRIERALAAERAAAEGRPAPRH